MDPDLIERLKRLRQYGSFFEWPDKSVKELGVVQQFIESVSARGWWMLSDPRPHTPDPPDCVALDAMGNAVALEVVELVSRKAIELTARGERVTCWWSAAGIREAVENLLRSKDCKRYSGGPYADIALVIHTDEPVLMPDDVRDALRGVSFGPFENLTKAYILFSYIPTKGYEVVEVSLAGGET